MDNTEKYTHLSICAGYDGIGLGFKLAGVDIRKTIYVEVEAFACCNLAKKIEEGKLAPGAIWTDVKTFDGTQFKGGIAILSGGFPCQPFSVAGQRKGEKDSRHLYPEIGRIISECEPAIVFLENVEGIITAKCGDGTPVLLYVLRDLEQRGYTATWGIFSAAEVGAPHQRKRVFILAYRNSEGLEKCGSQSICENEGTERTRSTIASRSYQWPARPGQRQYDWEPPRVC